MSSTLYGLGGHRLLHRGNLAQPTRSASRSSRSTSTSRNTRRTSAFNLVRFRENSEGVALYHGEEDELRGFRSRFAAVVDKLVGDHEAAKLLTFFHRGLHPGGGRVSFRRGAPRYFSGAIQLGGLVQISNAFRARCRAHFPGSSARTPTSPAWRPPWTVSPASTKQSFYPEENRAGIGPAVVADAAIDDLELRNLDLALPTGRVLVSGINARIEPGEHVLIKGPSGSGQEHRCSAPLPGSGPSAGGKSGSPAISARFSCRSALTFPSAPCAR